MRAVLIKFPTPHRVSSVKGDQKSARTYYISSVKLKTKVTYEAYCVEANDGATPSSSAAVNLRREISLVNP